ncbi:hypothetical protein C8A03DRAFT_42590 [Achaetomium macrosporum]|uniref:Transfer RNA methyltransferase 82 n=1 Tax=Achaetomium macrosporum TaxID=79813 RepID=A0AAN7HFB4_9PEZI|nr:hypothetical protein C8A03DRAFT_42590 [Achaetomium macrosporum]
MAIPCHLLKACGNFIFAAQGSSIHSLNSALEHISTWKYPVKQGDEPSGQTTEPRDSPALEGPPTKRRKVEDGQESASNGHAIDSANGQGKTKSVDKYAHPAYEKPFIQGLYATTDGRHLVAITGSDKTIWVFEHDGAGNLKQLSQRAMPKRPCSLALTRDNRTILSADKFGDVYALPLISSSPGATTTANTSHPTPTPPPLSRSATPSLPPKPQANELTVHTKRNLRALENQKISLTRKAQQQQESQQQQQTTQPQFEHILLLGHVSMLTAICVGTERVEEEADGAIREREREYIITADRDEHIRVSRGMPQAHVIEGFCLGHEEFVSRLCVGPGGRQEILVSGGGDDDLFVWDWATGRLLSRAGVLEHVKRVMRESVGKVAVTRLLGCRWKGRTCVFVVVERVPAVFLYELLEDNTLQHRETVPLPGNVLDVEVIELPGAAQRLLVAVDCSFSTDEPEKSTSSLIVLDKQEAAWQQTKVENLPAGGDINVSEDELQKILYTTESLRKLSDFD